MRTRYSLLNMTVSFAGQTVNVILLFVCRRIFILHFTREYLGINGLFTNILTVLSLAELGIGTAMIYGMYEPAARGDEETLCRLMNLYRILYRAVGGTVAFLGLLLLPFLPCLIKDYGTIPHITLIYLMYLADTVGSYFLSYRQAILTAFQRTFLITGVSQAVRSVQILLQIAAIIFFQNFYLYLALQLSSRFAVNGILSGLVKKEYPFLAGEKKELPDRATRKKFYQHIMALSFHRLGGVLVSHTDNLILSALTGLANVGLYSNYQMVLNSVKQMMSYVCGSFSAPIGNLAAVSDKGKIYEVYRALNFLFALFYGYLALCMSQLFNPFIALFFGEDYVLDMRTVLLIVLDFYLHGMRQITLRFRDGMGLYWHDRYKPLAESVINLTVSVALAARYSVAGVVAGTIVSTLLTNFWVEPLIFMKYGLGEGWKRKLFDYYVQYGSCFLLLAANVILIPVCFGAGKETVSGLVGRGTLCTICYGGTAALAFSRKQEWRYLLGRGKTLITRKAQRREHARDEKNREE